MSHEIGYHPDLKEKKIVLASHNQGKLKELVEALSLYPELSLLTATDFNLDEPIEDGQTFLDNAKIKAHYVASKTGLPSLADDSGLCIDAMGGRPGVHTAEWFTMDNGVRDFDFGFQKIKQEVFIDTDKSASMICILVLALPNGTDFIFEGKVNGEITLAPAGQSGFCLDPLFVPEGFQEPFAVLGPQIKSIHSARARALRKFEHFIGHSLQLVTH